MRTRLFIVSLLMSFSLLPLQGKETINGNDSFSMDEGLSLSIAVDSSFNFQRRPKVGLVLSGGGAKGSAHIGVIKVLEEVGIPIDYVTGTSMGSIVGALYALGYTSDEMDAIISDIDWPMYISDKVPFPLLSYQQKKKKSTFLVDVPFDTNKLDSLSIMQTLLNGGLVTGNNLENLFNSLAAGYQGDIDFNDLPVPFACVAADLLTGDEVVFHKGNLAQAIRSSMSIPGLFVPVWVDDKVLVDGGILNNIPIDVCREMGADIIISSMVGSTVQRKSREDMHSIIGVLGQLLGVVTAKHTNANIESSDFLIEPELEDAGVLSFEKEVISTLIGSGYHAADKHRDSLVELKNTLSQWGEEDPKARPAPKATNLQSTPMKIKSISTTGISESEQQWVMAKSHLDKVIGKTVTGKELDEYIVLIYGLDTFEKVNYSITKDSGTEEYDVTINFKKKPRNSFNVALRFDNQEASSILTRFAFNDREIIKPRFEVMAKMGYNPYVSLKASYAMRYTPKINVSYLLKKTETSINDFGEAFAATRLVKQRARIFISELYSRNWGCEVGLEFEQFLFAHMYTENVGIKLPGQGKGNPYLGLFANYTFDSRDKAVLPGRGMTVELSGSYKFHDFSNPQSFHGMGDVMLHLQSYFTLSKRLVFNPQIHSRFFFGEGYWDIGDRQPNCYDIVYNNYLGGLVPGRFVDQQMPFIGVNKPEMMDDELVIAMGELRYNVHGRHYISLVGSVARESSSLANMFKPRSITDADKQWWSASNFWGAGLRYTLSLPISPLIVDVAYSDITKKVGIYISTGMNF